MFLATIADGNITASLGESGTEKTHKRFQHKLLAPTQTPDFGPRKKVPHFLGKDAPKGPT